MIPTENRFGGRVKRLNRAVLRADHHTLGHVVKEGLVLGFLFDALVRLRGKIPNLGLKLLVLVPESENLAE